MRAPAGAHGELRFALVDDIRELRLPRSPSLQGNFAPYRNDAGDEEDLELSVTSGAIPDELVGGKLIRIGPNPHFEPVVAAAYASFDGDGMMNAFTFVAADRVDFRSRYVRTARFEKESAAGHAIFAGVAGPFFLTPSEGWRAAGYNLFEEAATRARAFAFGAERADWDVFASFLTGANTNLALNGGLLLALEEEWKPYIIDPDTLATQPGVHTYGGALHGALIAHPLVDPDSKQTYTIGCSPFDPYVYYYVIDESGLIVRQKAVDPSPPFPALMHSFAITETRAVLPHFPVTVRPENLGALLGIRWEPEEGARIGVMPRSGDSADLVTWYDLAEPIDGESHFAFHLMNAYDLDDGGIVVYATRYAGSPLGIPFEAPVPKPLLARWTLDPRRAVFTEEIFPKHVGAEFPIIDERVRGRKNRYGWFHYRDGEPALDVANAIACVDFDTGLDTSISFGANAGVGEPVFVPRRASCTEGDGWILLLVYEGEAGEDEEAKGKTKLVVLKALTLEVVATVQMDRRIPFDFHGIWLPAESLAEAPTRRARPGRVTGGTDATRKKIAIIGGGAAGLGAARSLYVDHDVTIFEAEPELGGHAHTVPVTTANGTNVHVDMGFILFNPAAYPNFQAMLDELVIGKKPVSLSMGATFVDFGLTTSWRTDDVGWYALHFAELGLLLLTIPDDELAPLEEIVARLGGGAFHRQVVTRVIEPLLSCFMVTRASLMRQPAGQAASMMRALWGSFLADDLKMGTIAGWAMVEGGSRTYVEGLKAKIGAANFRTGTRIQSVRRAGGQVIVTPEGQAPITFDHVIFATDAAAALAMLEDPRPRENELLGAFSYQSSTVYLHQDPDFLKLKTDPPMMEYRGDPGDDATTGLKGTMTLNLGRALEVDGPLVTIGDGQSVPANIVATKEWRHIVVTRESYIAGRQLEQIQGKDPADGSDTNTWFCGTYTTAALHEGAFVSGLVIGERIGGVYPYASDPKAQAGFDGFRALMFPSDNPAVGTVVGVFGSLGQPPGP